MSSEDEAGSEVVFIIKKRLVMRFLGMAVHVDDKSFSLPTQKFCHTDRHLIFITDRQQQHRGVSQRTPVCNSFPSNSFSFLFIEILQQHFFTENVIINTMVYFLFLVFLWSQIINVGAMGKREG